MQIKDLLKGFEFNNIESIAVRDGANKVYVSKQTLLEQFGDKEFDGYTMTPIYHYELEIELDKGDK